MTNFDWPDVAQIKSEAARDFAERKIRQIEAAWKPATDEHECAEIVARSIRLAENITEAINGNLDPLRAIREAGK